MKCSNYYSPVSSIFLAEQWGFMTRTNREEYTILSLTLGLLSLEAGVVGPLRAAMAEVGGGKALLVLHYQGTAHRLKIFSGTPRSELLDGICARVGRMDRNDYREGFASLRFSARSGQNSVLENGQTFATYQNFPTIPLSQVGIDRFDLLDIMDEDGDPVLVSGYIPDGTHLSPRPFIRRGIRCIGSW